MNGFWPRYLVMALLGTLTIHLGAPHLEAYLAGQQKGSVRDEAPRAQEAAAPRPAAVPRRPSAPAIAMPADPDDGGAATSSASPSADGALAVEAEPAGVEVAPVPSFTPSTRRMPTSGEGVTHWGLTIRQAAFYTREGTRRAESLDGGTLIEQVGSTTSSSKGELALCRVAREHGWVGPYLIATADLLRFPGTREQVDDEDVRALQRYHELNGLLEARTLSLRRAAVDANPCTAPLRAAHAAYQEAQARARKLTAERNTTAGAVRAELADELRRLQNEEPLLRQRVDEANSRYKAWKEQNGNTVAGSDPEADPIAQGYRREMAALRPRLAPYGVR